MNALRPGDGSVCSAAESSAVPVDAFDVSISGAWPVTVTFSVIDADFHREVEGEELLRADANAAAVGRLVALQRRLDCVVAGIDVGERRTRRARW